MLEKILVPLDGSEAGESALSCAEEVVAALHSQLTLLHVYEPQEETHRKTFESYLDSVRSRLIGSLGDRVPAGSVTCATSISPKGNAASAIVDFAQRGGFGLIMLASHGASGIMPWSLGSTASKVTHDLRVPVLVVRAGRQEPRANLFSSIVVPLDMSEEGEAALPYVREIAARTKARIALVYISSSSEHVRSIGGIDYFRLPESVMEKMRADAQDYLGRVKSTFAGTQALVTAEVREGNPAQEIINTGGISAGLIAMSSHGRSGVGQWLFGSVSEKVLQSARTPVLFVCARARA